MDVYTNICPGRHEILIYGSPVWSVYSNFWLECLGWRRAVAGQAASVQMGEDTFSSPNTND
jgi:hypothetical protein